MLGRFHIHIWRSVVIFGAPVAECKLCKKITFNPRWPLWRVDRTRRGRYG